MAQVLSPTAQAQISQRDGVHSAQALRITEIFYSLQGEALTAGLPTVFIRLTGCPLRCHYCDTEYAFSGGQRMLLDDILTQVAEYKTHAVCVTGGEPLAQPGCADLVKILCDQGYDVSVETSGAMDIRPVDTRASRVVDLKTPGSGEVARNKLDNLQVLTAHDQIKFVLCDRADFDWASDMLRHYDLTRKCTVWFSPSYGQLKPVDLAQWILDAHLPVRMQLQLHKLVWDDEPGR